jgi:hypothetical protein
MHKSLKLSTICATLALAIPLAAQAQPREGDWARHPHYRRAMADVSQAFILLKHARGDPPARPEETRAMTAIEYAFTTLQNAAEVDDKDPDDIPPADHSRYDFRGRVHRALDLLHDAYAAVDVEEVNPDARFLKARALQQIDLAAHATEDAIRVMDF